MRLPVDVRAEIVGIRARGLAAELVRLSLPAGDAKRLGRMAEALIASADELIAETTTDRRPTVPADPAATGKVVQFPGRRCA